MEPEGRQTQFLYDTRAEPYLRKWQHVFQNPYASASTYFRQKLFERAFSLLDLQPGETFLDLGCGTSTALSQLKPRGARLHGMDLSLTMLKTGREFHGLQEDVRYVQADALHCPFQPGAFDKILSIEVETYVRNRKEFLQGVYESLRSGGTAVLSVTNLLSFDLFPARYSLRRCLGRIRREEYPRFFHTKGALVRMLRDLQVSFTIEPFGWYNSGLEYLLGKASTKRFFERYDSLEGLLRSVPGAGYLSNIFLLCLRKTPTRHSSLQRDQVYRSQKSIA